MAIIRKKIENLKAGEDYIISVKPRNTDVNADGDPLAAIRFTVPRDSTVPADVANLQLYASFEKVMFKFDFGQEEDISHYLYELYTANEAIEANLVTSGRNAANVFTVSVENSSQAAGGSLVTKSYWGRVRAVDTSGNQSNWTQLQQTDQNTPLIDEQYIDSLTASKITAGTIGAHTINLNGANSIIQSSNYSTGSTGWQIKGDGSAEFGAASIRGDLNAGSVTIGDGTYNYWNKSGAANDFRVGDDTKYIEWDNSAATLTIAGNLVAATGSFSGDISGSNGSFSGTLSGVSGSFSGDVTVGTHATNKITLVSDSTATGTKIHSGTGTYSNANTGFYFDASGQMSLGNKFIWDGEDLILNGIPSDADLDINGAIITGGIIRTSEDTATGDAVVLQDDQLFLINKDTTSPGTAQIKFQASSNTVAGVITSDAGGIEISTTGRTGTPKVIVGRNTTSPTISQQMWGATLLELTQATNTGGQATLELFGGNSSYISAENYQVKDVGASNDLSIKWSDDPDTGLFRFHDGIDGTGVGLVANGVLGLTAHRTSGGNQVYMLVGSTTTTSGYRFLLRNTTYGGVAEYSSNRDLKENILSFDYSGTIIDALNPVKYNPAWTSEDVEDETDKTLRENDIQHGFIAEEVAEVMGGELATYDENFNPTGWRWPDMIAVCVAEIKSLRARVAQLEAM